MADQWNSNIPAMGNQLSADVPDIKENLEHAKDAFERIFNSFSTTAGGNATAKFNAATGFTDGTYNYLFPTNGVGASSVIMLGNSSTVAWFYLNTAPPGWKALSTGADSVLAIAGGSGDYNVSGGNPDTANTWTIDGLSAANESSHTHTLATSGNSVTGTTSNNIGISSGAFVLVSENGGSAYAKPTTATGGGSAHNHTISQDASYRPKASVGKLFQLDTA